MTAMESECSSNQAPPQSDTYIMWKKTINQYKMNQGITVKVTSHLLYHLSPGGTVYGN